MTNCRNPQRLLRAVLFSSLGLLTLELMRPGDVHAEECTIDPFGGEVCLPSTPSVDPPEDPDDPPKSPPEFGLIPPCFGNCTQFPPPTPFRQFEEDPEPDPEPEPTPEPIPEVEPEPIRPEPIQPLWLKSDALDPAVAENYFNQTFKLYAQAQSDAVVFEAADDALFIEVDGVRYREITEPHGALFTNEGNEPAVNVWVRGFGGSSSSGSTGNRHADFDNGGAQLGFDIPLSDQTRIGLFGTYAVMDGDDGSRGSWDADGWGGGAYAEYWSNTFVLRGMVSAGGYDGEHQRSVNGETAKGDRSGNSWTGVISVGAPMDSGDWLIEPQALISYTNTSLDRFSESGANRNDRLRFHEMEVDQVGSELTVKFAHPIRDGERSLFLPSVRVGWAADWGLSGDSQKVTFLDSGKSKRWSVNSSDSHAALVELGLDYTTFNFNDNSVAVYARGGALIWGGDRGTSWQLQGGLSFRF